jgi:hypothetical protein
MTASPYRRSPQRLDEFIARRIEVHEHNIHRLEETIKHLDDTSHTTASSAHVDASSAKKVDTEELQAIVERLSRPLDRSRSEDIVPIPKGNARVLAIEEVEELVDRLGVRDIATRNEKRDGRLAAAEESLPLKQIQQAKGDDALIRLEGDQQQALGERLCNQALEQRRETLKKLGDDLFTSKMKTTDVISKQRARQCALRLCDSSLSKKQSEMTKLQEKYMSPLVAQRKLSLEEQKSCGDRLSKK